MNAIYTLADLRDWEKKTRDISPPIRLGVLGDPVAHSLSPQMQNAALQESEHRHAYTRLSKSRLTNWRPRCSCFASSTSSAST